jgi:hypothetical protein
MSSNDEHFIAHQAHQRFKSTPREIIGVSGISADLSCCWRVLYPAAVLLILVFSRQRQAALFARKIS